MGTNPNKPITDQERLAWIRLIRSDYVGVATFHDLLQHFGSAEEALAALPELAKRGGRLKKVVVCPEEKALHELELHKKKGAKLITQLDPEYPALLKAIPDAPPLLSALGNLELLKRDSFAIVGARNASLHGQNFANKTAKALGQQGWVVTSGLARGIDGATHKGALETGTIAVIAGGVDILYPPEHKALYEAVKKQGLVLSEAPLSAQPQSNYFPRRNRIISGLSKGVLVVEATLKSGSLITAQYAIEQNRDVFAVPGSPFDPRCRGTNTLIQQGATLTQGVEDITKHYAQLFQHPSFWEKPEPLEAPEKQTHILDMNLEETRLKILETLSFSPISLDELVRQCQTSPEKVQAAILELELAGQAVRSSGGHISLAAG